MKNLQFSERLKKILSIKNMDATSLGKKANLPRTTINYILSSKDACPKIDTFFEIVNALEVKIEDLINPEAYKHFNSSPIDEADKRIEDAIKILGETNKVPVLHTNDVIDWCTNDHFHQIQNVEFVTSREKLPPKSFAFNTGPTQKFIFLANSIAIVAFGQQTREGKYVIATIKRNTPVIRQVQTDGYNMFLKSHIETTFPVLIDDTISILGEIQEVHHYV